MPTRGNGTEPVDRRPDGLWDGCHDDPISPGDAHAVAAGWANTTQLSNALDAAAFEIERLRATLEEIGLPGHVPNGFDPLEWWRHTACKRGEVARDALGVTAEELISKKWHEYVEATR